VQDLLIETFPTELRNLNPDSVGDIDSISLINMLADLQQHGVSTVLNLLPPDQARRKQRLARRCTGRSSFKDGFSPELIILKDYIHILHSLIHTLPHLRHSEARRMIRVLLWNCRKRFPSSPILNKLGHFHPNSLLLRMHTTSISSPLLHNVIHNIKSKLHGKTRQLYRSQMNQRIRLMEDQVKLWKSLAVIRKLTDKPFQPVDLSYLRDLEGNFLDNPKHIHAAILRHFNSWHAAPPVMDPSSVRLHRDPLFPSLLLAPTPPDTLHTDSTIPLPLQHKLITSIRRPLPMGVEEEMSAAVSAPVPLQAFLAAVKGQPSGKAPGPSGLTANMIKSWPD
jgi:hypothetical protein